MQIEISRSFSDSIFVVRFAVRYDTSVAEASGVSSRRDFGRVLIGWQAAIK